MFRNLISTLYKIMFRNFNKWNHKIYNLKCSKNLITFEIKILQDFEERWVNSIDHYVSFFIGQFYVILIIIYLFWVTLMGNSLHFATPSSSNSKS